MKKRIMQFIFFIFIFMVCRSVDAATIKIDTNKIYFLDDQDKEFVTMKSSYKTQAKITVTGASNVTYKSMDSTDDMSRIEVSSDGIVTIKPYYCTGGGFSTCTTVPNDNLYKNYDERSADIVVSADGVDYKVHVESIDYSRIYIDEFFDSIIKKYPSDTSTERGKLQPILDWISKETDYSVNYSYTKDMIFHSAGDCWASSRVIVDFAKKVGVNAVVRENAKYLDANAGSGHENVYAELDGIGYVIDAGYNEAKPRRVVFVETENGWYTGKTNIYSVGDKYLSYHGFEKNVSVPENNVITGLRYWALKYGLSEKSQIETIYIPKTITEIDSRALANVPTLKSITVDKDNPNYLSFDGVLFSKDKKTLITYPSGKNVKKNTLYDFVETIESYGVSDNEYVEELIIPEGVKTLKANAIVGNFNLKYIDVAESVDVIEEKAIVNQGQDYTVIRNKNAQIGSLPCSKYTYLFGPRGSTTEEYATKNSCNFTALEDIGGDPSKVKVITLDDIEVEDATYTGSPIIPKIKVVVDGKTLVENKDYFVEDFHHNIETGNSYFYLQGMGYYVGREIVNFNIEKKDIDWEYTNPVVDYNGKAQSPLVVVHDSFFKGKVSYPIHPSHSDKREKAEYTEPGEYRLGLNIDGDYNYNSVSQYITFKIKGIDISKAKIEKIDDYIYTTEGEYLSEIKNKKVTLNGKTLVKDTDYTTKITSVRVDDNNNSIYCLTVTGKGLYEGVVTSNEFMIAKNYSLELNYKDGQFMKPGEKLQLVISSSIGLPLEQNHFTFKSYNTDVVSVDDNGKISALKEGSAEIYIKSTLYNKTLWITIRVSNERVPMEAMVLSRGSITTSITVGGSISVYGSFYPSNTTDSRKLTYQSSDESILTVNSNGLVRGIREGVATVTATTSGGFVDRIKIFVGTNPESIPLKSISLLRRPSSLEVGDTYTDLSIGFNPSDTTISKNLTYRSSNPSVASIDSTGKITALKVGKTYIIVNANEEYSQVFELMVNPKKSLTLDKDSLELEGNESLSNHTYKLVPTLTNITGNVSYKSSNTSVATVSSDGTITAKNAGNAIITASVGSYQAKCNIIVSVHPSSISPNKKSLTLEEGNEETITITYNPTNTSVKNLTWKSSNASIATVDSKGKITAKKAGSTTITATTQNNKKTTITVTVIEKPIYPEKVAISNSISSLGVGESVLLTPSFTPTNTNQKIVTWTSSDKNVATIDSNGKVTALKEGATTITVKTSNNKTASFKLTVVKKNIAVDSISFNDVSKEFGVGEVVSLVPNISPSNATNKSVTWTSSDTSIVTVDQTGTAQVIGEGSAVITAKTNNGKEASITIIGQYRTPSVYYMTHVQDYGNQDYVKDGAMSGTSGQSKRLEAIRMNIKWSKYSGDIEYRTHVEDYGWMNYVKNDAMSGTSGQAKRLEAIQIRLTGELGEHYDVYYRVHAQDVGWMNWAKNDEMSGTAGYGRRLEGIEIVLVQKGQNPPTRNDLKSNKAFLQKQVLYTTHVQDIGWQSEVADGEMSGTSGQSKRLEGIKIHFYKPDVSGDIEYRTHVQDIGWQDFVKNGEMSGTSGQSKRLEAIEIRLTGEMEKKYDIYYRVHAQDVGWMNWAKNGEKSGTAGYGRRLEGIEIVIVDKGEAPPNRNNIHTDKSFIDKNA